MAKINLSSPWVTFYREIDAMFKGDKEITTVYDEENRHISLYVANANKADALTQLLPPEVTFGNVTLKISVIPSNSETSLATLFQRAFEKNPAFVGVKTLKDVFSNDITYVIFGNKVVQFFNDDLSDINGNCSTLYQEIAKEIFQREDGVFYCTDTKEDYSW